MNVPERGDAGFQAWWKDARDGEVARRALWVAVVVGTLLAGINHGPELLRGHLPPGVWLQILLTYVVPYAVSTLASVSTLARQRRIERKELGELAAQVEAIERFPGQNPHPVWRLDSAGSVLYCNSSGQLLLAELGGEVGAALPEALRNELQRAASADGAAVEVRAGRSIFTLLPVHVPDLAVINVYGTDVTAARVMDKFPDQNPHPVLRIDEGGILRYANAAAAPIVEALGAAPDALVPPVALAELRVRLDAGRDDPFELQGARRTWALTPVAVPEFSMINVYGIDVTAARFINKFPDQNPHPVLRTSAEGELLYANPAAAPVLAIWQIDVGDRVPDAVADAIASAAGGHCSDAVEQAGDGRIFSLLIVPVHEFGFVNIYGTDITAAREVERAHRENERLLLNILPASIAKRLRDGETTIADRFDEVTILFADVVGFTEMSARLSPSWIVGMLNDVFSIFDRLADRYGLEKIKTIGDAYMVVGGLAEGRADHSGGIARVALDMLREVNDYRDGRFDRLDIRIGMHSGPAVAGVIGIKKFIYDVWGDTVNTASRMESHGLPGRIQVTEAVRTRLGDDFEFESRGEIEIKGKGRLPVWWLLAERPA